MAFVILLFFPHRLLYMPAVKAGHFYFGFLISAIFTPILSFLILLIISKSITPTKQNLLKKTYTPFSKGNIRIFKIPDTF